jgi:hypothetical protein
MFLGVIVAGVGNVGTMPLAFGIIDGWLHVTAGFLGLVVAFCYL